MHSAKWLYTVDRNDGAGCTPDPAFIRLAGKKREARVKNQESRTKNQEPRTKNQESRIKNQEPGAVQLLSFIKNNRSGAGIYLARELY